MQGFTILRPVGTILAAIQLAMYVQCDCALFSAEPVLLNNLLRVSRASVWSDADIDCGIGTISSTVGSMGVAIAGAEV